MSQAQKDIVFRILAEHDGFFHHGDCIGADAEGHDVAQLLGNYSIHVHPPVNPRLRAYKNGHVNHPPKDYYARNADIVQQCHYLIATPVGKEQIGGTWNTIKFAMRKDINRQFTIILPNGQMGHSVFTPDKGSKFDPNAMEKRWNG